VIVTSVGSLPSRRLTIVGGGRDALVGWRRGREKTVCARVARPALVRSPSTSPLGATVAQRIVALLVAALLVGAYFYDRFLGVRAFGVTELVGAVYLFRGGQFAFDQQPGKPLRYWPRWLSMCVAIFLLAFGVLSLSVPKQVLSVLCSSPYHRCT